MSKKYKGKTCVYCGTNSSTTADHVIAREFFLTSRRDNLPKAPACGKCNTEKSTLEHYLTAILPFGGRHSDALANLELMVPKRLQKNAKLHAELRAGHVQGPLALLAPDGTWERPTSIPLDHVPLEELFALIAKGLAWHHWGVVLEPGYSAIARVFPDTAAPFLEEFFFARKAADRVTADVGAGTFAYEGLQATDDPKLTVWSFSIYGGVSFGGDPKLPAEKASQIIGITGPNGLIQTLEGKLFNKSPA